MKHENTPAGVIHSAKITKQHNTRWNMKTHSRVSPLHKNEQYKTTHNNKTKWNMKTHMLVSYTPQKSTKKQQHKTRQCTDDTWKPTLVSRHYTRMNNSKPHKTTQYTTKRENPLACIRTRLCDQLKCVHIPVAHANNLCAGRHCHVELFLVVDFHHRIHACVCVCMRIFVYVCITYG